jgi:hypothetical protein
MTHATSPSETTLRAHFEKVIIRIYEIHAAVPTQRIVRAHIHPVLGIISKG